MNAIITCDCLYFTKSKDNIHTCIRHCYIQNHELGALQSVFVALLLRGCANRRRNQIELWNGISQRIIAPLRFPKIRLDQIRNRNPFTRRNIRTLTLWSIQRIWKKAQNRCFFWTLSRHCARLWYPKSITSPGRSCRLTTSCSNQRRRFMR